MPGWFKGFRIPRPTGQGMRTAALFMAAPLFGGLLAWQLYGLEPERVCKTSFDMAKVDGAGLLVAFQACVGLLSKSLDIKDHAIIGLLVILGIGYMMMLMRETRMQGEFRGPLGIGGSFRADDGRPPITPTKAAEKVAEAAVDKAVEIKETIAPRPAAPPPEE